jgi:hypothetical protein
MGRDCAWKKGRSRGRGGSEVGGLVLFVCVCVCVCCDVDDDEVVVCEG